MTKPLAYLRERPLGILALAMAYSRVARGGQPVEKRVKRPRKIDDRQLTLKGMEPTK